LKYYFSISIIIFMSNSNLYYFYCILRYFILFSTTVQYCKWCYTNVILW